MKRSGGLQRRTGLTRRAALTGGTPLSRKAPLRRPAPADPQPGKPTAPAKPRKRPAARTGPRSTGPDAATRGLVEARAGGRCERCGTRPAGHARHEIQHRRARGQGGSRNDPAINSPTNLVLLCEACHRTGPDAVELHRADAQAAGWIVRRPTDPATVPIAHWRHGPVRLTPDGRYTP